MGLLKIDESACDKDELCVIDCPAGIIQMPGGGYPLVASADESACLICGHCVAVCPHGALSHDLVPLEDSPAIQKKLAISQEQAVQFLRSRRSIRLYEDRPVEKEKIERLIGIARYAPTGSNSQLVEWLVIRDHSRINQIAGLAVGWVRQRLGDNPGLAASMPFLRRAVTAWDEGSDAVLRNAHALVIASAPKEARNGMVDLTLALSYLDLVAPTMGLGTCWAGLLQAALVASPPIKEAVGVPAAHPHHYPMMLGYPKIQHYRLPERKPPKITFA